MRPDPVVTPEEKAATVQTIDRMTGVITQCKQIIEASTLAEALILGLPLDKVPDQRLLDALAGFELSLTLLNPYLPREGEILAEPLASLWHHRQRLRQEALRRKLIQEDGSEEGP